MVIGSNGFVQRTLCLTWWICCHFRWTWSSYELKKPLLV